MAKKGDEGKANNVAELFGARLVRRRKASSPSV